MVELAGAPRKLISIESALDRRRGAVIAACVLAATTHSGRANAASLVDDTPSVPHQRYLASARTPGAANMIAAAATAVGDQAGAGAAAAATSAPTLAPASAGDAAGTDGPRTGTNDRDRDGRTAVAFRPSADLDAAEPDQLLSLYQDGAGQAQTSMSEIDLVLNRRQVFSDLRTLQTRLNDLQRPTFNVVDRYSTQSDKLDINQLEVSQDLFFSSGRDNLRLGAQRISYDAPGPDDVLQYVAGFTGNVRINDIAAVAGEFWVNRLDYTRGGDTLVTFDTFLTLRPSDVVRIDIDTSRRTFDNIRSLQLGLTAQSYGGSIDYVPNDQLRFTGRLFGASYSDHNRRRTEEIEIVWRATSKPLLEFGVRGTNFHFSRLLNNGYFNPREYYSAEALFRLQSELSPRFTVEVAGSGGAEEAHPGGIKPLVKGSLQAVYKLPNGWSIDGETAHFTSRGDSSSSGFARTSFTLGLHYRY